MSLLSNSIRNLSQVMDGEKVIELALDLIDPDPTQPRKTFDESGMSDIAASIRASRVHEPIIVTQRGTRYMIVFGERRWRGSGMAEKKTIPAIVRNMSDVDIKVARLVENMQREDVKPIEEAAAIKELIEVLGNGRGVQKKAADLLGCSEAKISQYLALLELPQPIREAVEAGHIADATTALDVARVHAVDPQAASGLMEKAKTGDLKRAEVRGTVKAVKEKSAAGGKATGKGKLEEVAGRCDQTVDMWPSHDNSDDPHAHLSVCQNPFDERRSAVLSDLLNGFADGESALVGLAHIVRVTLARGAAFGLDESEIMAAAYGGNHTKKSGHGG